MKLIIIADNLGGGAARFGHFLINSIAKKIGWDNLIILGNDRIGLDIKNIEQSFKYVELQKSWIPRFLQRQKLVKKYSKGAKVLNLTNFPIGTYFLPSSKEICIIHSAYFFALPGNLFSFNVKFILKVIIARRVLFNILRFFSIAPQTIFVVQTPWMKSLAKKSLPTKFKIELAKFHGWPFTLNADTEGIFLNLNKKSKKETLWFYPATSEPHKNHTLLFKLFSEALKLQPNIKLIVTLPFDNVFTKELTQTLNSLSIHHAVKNIGWVSENQKNYLLQNCSGVIFLSEFESLGIPLLEIRELSKSAIVIKSEASEYRLGEGSFIYDLNSEILHKRKSERDRAIRTLCSSPSAKYDYGDKKTTDICDAYFFDLVKAEL